MFLGERLEVMTPNLLDQGIDTPLLVPKVGLSRPGELFEPFKADEWFLVVSLLYRFESSYDDISRKTLGQLLFSAKVAEFMPEVSKQLLRPHLASSPG